MARESKEYLNKQQEGSAFVRKTTKLMGFYSGDEHLNPATSIVPRG